MNRTGRLIAVLFAIVAGLSCGSRGEAAEGTSDNGSAPAASAASESGLPLLIDLGSTTCVPCRMMTDELAMLDSLTGDDLEIRIIDVNASPDEASDFGVRVIPTQIFLSESGEELFRHEGFISCEDMMALWMEMGYSFQTGD